MTGVGPTSRQLRNSPDVPAPGYRLLSLVVTPVLLVHLVVRALRDGGWRYARERLGFGPRRPDAEPPPRWIHAASVGEVLTVLPLLEATLDAEPDTTILITTNTPTGAAVLAHHALARVHHRYLPIDRPGATRRFVERERPRSGWIVETELWPWLYARCRAAGVPLAIVNARLSSRTQRHAGGPLGETYRRTLAGVDVLARTAEDATGYRALGAESARLRTIGNLKLAAAASRESLAAPIARPYVLAASTHEDEETQLAEAWLALPDRGLLVIAPRHPERGAGLARTLGSLARAADGTDARCARRALGELPGRRDRLYLADTLGELETWYAHARGVFVGGSLVARGGHNVLEPARLARPIVVGPHTGNFADVMASLRTARAVTEVDEATAATAFLARAASGDETLSKQGMRAREAVADSGGIVARYLEALGTPASGSGATTR